MIKEDLVSIIMPSYNCGRFVEETIRSVQAQTYQNWEIIFVDDCSEDDTVSKVMALATGDTRIKLYCNTENSGAAISRNYALQIAEGRGIAFLDSDDLWEPTKLEKQIAFMKKSGYAFSYHEYIEIGEDGTELGVHVSGKSHIGKISMYSCCWPGCLSVMYDADYVGLVQINDVRKNNDTAVWLKVIQKTDCFLLKETLGKYRRRRGSITMQGIPAKIGWHYILFRDAEGMNPVVATFWTCMNIMVNSYKKIFYIKRYKV